MFVTRPSGWCMGAASMPRRMMPLRAWAQLARCRSDEQRMPDQLSSHTHTTRIHPMSRQATIPSPNRKDQFTTKEGMLFHDSNTQMQKATCG